MIESDDIAYYLRRERDSRASAERATDRGIEIIHAQMADAYRQRIDGATEATGDPAAPIPMPVAPIAAE